MMLLDVQKAFDSVNHRMLCEKIRLAGIDESWFKSYLEGRKQIVFVNNCTSTEKTITCGVPQGSLLGPWCYLLYCNDIASCVSCTLILYADDTVLLVSHRDIDAVSSLLSAAAGKCFHWLVNNCLSMHMGKTEVIVFSSKRKRSRTRNFVVNLQDHVIKPMQEVKYLGLKMDNTLSGETVVKDILAKCNNRLKFLYRHKDCLNRKMRKLLSLALIQCYFDYAISSWFMGLTKASKGKLQVAQNKIIRFILDLGPRASIGQQELDQVDLLNTSDRAKQLILSHMFNIKNDLAPSYLSQHFFPVNHGYSTRGSENNFIVPRPIGVTSGSFGLQWFKTLERVAFRVKKSD